MHFPQEGQLSTFAQKKIPVDCVHDESACCDVPVLPKHPVFSNDQHSHVYSDDDIDAVDSCFRENLRPSPRCANTCIPGIDSECRDLVRVLASIYKFVENLDFAT